MGLLAGSCPTLTLQRQQDIGLRVLTETTEQVGLGGLTISRKESICLLLTWDILENRESVELGQSSDREREEWSEQGREGLGCITPLLGPACVANPPPHRRGTSSNQVWECRLRETRRGAALGNKPYKPNKPSFRKPCLNKNRGECQKGWLPRPPFSVTLSFQQAKWPMASCQHVSKPINCGQQTVGVITSMTQKQHFLVLLFWPTRLVGCAGHGSRGLPAAGALSISDNPAFACLPPRCPRRGLVILSWHRTDECPRLADAAACRKAYAAAGLQTARASWPASSCYFFPKHHWIDIDSALGLGSGGERRGGASRSDPRKWFLT